MKKIFFKYKRIIINTKIFMYILYFNSLLLMSLKLLNKLNYINTFNNLKC